jgi:hypothetical protein
MTEQVDDFLVHYGVKGMKWGRRKDRAEGESRFSPEQKAKLKRAAIIAGTTVVVGALAVGSVYVAQNSGTKVPANAKTKAAEDFVKAKIQEQQTGIIHATRGKNKGFSFYDKGGLTEALDEYTSAFGSDSEGGTLFKRVGNNGEKVAARFNDPDGRKDRAGRVIPHEVILPEPLAKGVTNLDEAIAKVWPMIKDTVESRYDPPNFDATPKPKAPSPYPTTPLIKTPILDEINNKYGW